MSKVRATLNFRHYICMLLLFFLCTASRSQSNSCGLVARMSPEGDSTFSNQITVAFQNTSTNATDYRFIVDLYVFGMNTPLNWSFSVGLTTVKLVAYNGACTDTAVAYYFFPGYFPSGTSNVRRVYGFPNRDNMVGGINTTGDGGYLLNGRREGSSFFQEPQQGLVIKSKPTGCVEWARKINTPFGGTDIPLVKEAADGNIFMIATVIFESQQLVKLDANGNTIWSRSLQDGAGSYQQFTGFETLADGGIITISSPQTFSTFYITRFDANGQIVWQRHIDYNSAWAYGFRYFLVKDGHLYIGGTMSYSNNFTYIAVISKFDLSNGQTIWTKRYDGTPSPIGISDLISVDSTIVVGITGSTGDITRTVVGGVMRIDTSGNVLHSKFVCESYTPNGLFSPFGIGSSRLTRSGKNFYIISAGAYNLSLQGDGRNSKIIRLDSNYNVRWAKANGGVGQPRYYFHSPAVDDGVRIAGVEISPGISANGFGTLINMWPIDSAGGNPNESCFFPTFDYYVFPAPVVRAPIQWTIDEAASNISEARPTPLYDFYPDMRFRCPEYVDSCSYLKVTGTTSVCNLTQSYTFKSHRNKACGQPTQWEVSAGIQVISQTDSSATVRFLNFGRHVLYGKNLLGCIPTQDSIVVIAASNTPPLNLGADQQICPQNTTTLHAGPKFFAYEWQDGSTDSLLLVNQPGQYWVQTTDSCNNVQRDTIVILLAPPIPFSVGPDRTKCNTDTLHLNAPSGFLNYSWSPAYNVSAANAQNMVVNPPVDTTYTIMAEKTPGCFAYDTIGVKVFHSPAINLGIDTSFCRGDSVILNAGNGFTGYVWNTGALNQQLVVHNAGEYYVTASTSDGCRSYDTLKVLQVFSLPTPHLDSNPMICEGATRILDAGAGYTNYLWNDGSISQTIQVSSPGNYAVEVTDNHGCNGETATVINRVQPLPFKFLPRDTAICSYGTLTLQTLQPYTSYLWSNGSIQSSITISTPGEYWLQVTDMEHCAGRDTILVNPKDCMKGLFVPTAFTPNGDGKNDEFRPLLFGNIVKYKFTVYNRWGTVVYQSNTPGKGWNGSYAGVLQDNFVFIWTCSYQLEGEQERIEKGTVVLMK